MKCPEWLLDAMRKGESVKCTAKLCGEEEIVCISGFDTSEKQNAFFDAVGTAYSDAEPYKEPAHEFRPFDRVLVRVESDDLWNADLFSHTISGVRCKFVCSGQSFAQCIPYEGNEALLGTTNSPESK